MSRESGSGDIILVIHLVEYSVLFYRLSLEFSSAAVVEEEGGLGGVRVFFCCFFYTKICNQGGMSVSCANVIIVMYVCIYMYTCVPVIFFFPPLSTPVFVLGG